MFSILKIGVILSCFVSFFSLSILVRKTFSFGRKPTYAQSRHRRMRGVIYAFSRGMMPWEKESAAKHLPTYIAGLLYHIGLFLALFYLFFLVFSLELDNTIILLLRISFSLALLCGLALIGKRILLPTMKKISCPDDFFANAIVDLFLLLSLWHTYTTSIAPAFFLVSIIMFLYIPVGKIRHCVFFFYTKILYGLFYGRRGILPPTRMI
ncbi:MAG: hypothetical protein JSV96_06450 [Candidatus Aminicenantes bacterium]|nr:MAG: hypothetical protein JSV96_06450 [Candidatus Aminicenantes bacterium]